MFFHKSDLVFRKSVDCLSSLKASTEEGSRGASPPCGEATVMEVCGERTW